MLSLLPAMASRWSGAEQSLSTERLGGVKQPPKLPIVLMSLQPAIPWRVALQHCSPPLHRLNGIMNYPCFAEKEFSLNSKCPNSVVSHSWGPPHWAS